MITFGILVGVELNADSHLTCDFRRPLHSTDDEYNPMKLFYETNWPDDYWWFVFSIVLQWCLYIAFVYNLAMSIYCHRCRCIRLFSPTLRMWGLDSCIFRSGNKTVEILKVHSKVDQLLSHYEHLHRKDKYKHYLLFWSNLWLIFRVPAYPGNVLALHMSKPQRFKYSRGRYIYVNRSVFFYSKWFLRLTYLLILIFEI